MSARLWNALVILKDHSGDSGADVNGNFDLSNKYITIEYQDTFPRNTVITLNAKGGRFITQTPKIQKWDRIYLEITDQAGAMQKQVFQIETLEKMRPRGKGLQLKLYCSHQSSNLLTQTISIPNRRSSGREAMQKVCRQMNENAGTSDPQINNIDSSFDSTTKRGIFLDEFTSNDYIFESVKAQTAIDEIIDREGNPVEGGGSFEFFYFNFDSAYVHPDNLLLNQVYVQCFPQGFVDIPANSPSFNNIPKVTLNKPPLEPGVHGNTLALDSELETEKGTNLIAIGDFQSGSYPTNYSKFRGAQEFFDAAKNWQTGVTYRAGTLVTFDGDTYECISLHQSSGANEPPNATFWLARKFDVDLIISWQTSVSFPVNTAVKHNTIGYKSLQTAVSNSTNEPPNPEFWRRLSWPPTVDYSPLTKEKVQYWINAMGGSNQSTLDNGRCAVIDPSVIIRDVNHPRTWVDGVAADSQVLNDYLFPNDDHDAPFEGFRVLVMEASTGDIVVPDVAGNLFAANYNITVSSGIDINGRPFSNNVVEWQIIDGLGQYVVIDLNSIYGDETRFPLSPLDNQLQTDQEVYNFDSGDSWIFFPLDNVGGRLQNWNKGAYYAISDNALFFDSNSQFSCVHHPQFDGTNSRIDMGNTRILKDTVDTSGNSAVFIKFDPRALETPFPLPVPVPILERFMGLNFAFPWPRTSQSLPFGAVTIGEQIDLPFFDIFNFDKTTKDNRQWFGPEVEEYYPFQGFGFEQFILDNVIGDLTPKFRGDYDFAVWVCDNRDRIWIIEYQQAHNDQTESKTAPFTARKVFRARFGFAGLVEPVEPEVVDIIDPRRIVRGGIYSKMAFNSSGQYDDRNKFSTSGTLEFAVDAFRLIKPLVCTNNDEPADLPERNKEPQKIQTEKIVSYPQLKNFVLSVAAIYNFRTDKYTVLTPGRNNISYGDPVYYTDPEAIDETTDALANTIKGVASNVIYSLSKTPDGPGGFIRHVELTTRLWPDAEVPA